MGGLSIDDHVSDVKALAAGRWKSRECKPADAILLMTICSTVKPITEGAKLSKHCTIRRRGKLVLRRLNEETL